MTWLDGRTYEDEYTLANRVGHIVGRKMVRENTKIVKFSVRPDNELTNWFSSEFLYYSTTYGGGWTNHMSRRCFRSELFSGWFQEQPKTNELYAARPCHALTIVRSKHTVMFLNVLGVSRDVWRTIWDLSTELMSLEQHEVKRSRECNLKIS
jgi:hypothetical protein